MIHVRDVGLKQASDEGIWGWARRRSYTIVTTDADFAGLSRRLGWPPKVIHLEECDFPLRIIEELLRQNSVRISEFEKGSVTGLLGLRFAPPLRQGFPVSRRYVHVARKHFGVREEESGSTSHIGHQTAAPEPKHFPSAPSSARSRTQPHRGTSALVVQARGNVRHHLWHRVSHYNILDWPPNSHELDPEDSASS
jgi:predicted nuclease of predicted toxin-antitoxin system